MGNTINIASAGDETFSATPSIFAGDNPPVATRDLLIPSSLSAIPQYTPLSFVDGAYKPWARTGFSVLTKQYAGVGNGAMSGLAVGANPVTETITVALKTAASNGGTFSVTGSRSGALADATVGVAYTSDAVNFTIADGGTDFAVGDFFDLEVVESNEQIVALTAYAIPNSASDQRAACYTAGMFNIDAAIWPANTTEDDVAAATSNSQVQFRKLLYSDKRVDQSGVLVGSAYEAPTTG